LLRRQIVDPKDGCCIFILHADNELLDYEVSHSRLDVNIHNHDDSLKYKIIIILDNFPSDFLNMKQISCIQPI
jgi:hypothetical protein